MKHYNQLDLFHKMKFFSRRQSLGEEIANAISHGIGAGLSIAALSLLVSLGALHGDAWRVVSFSVYGACLILLYLSSTLYHGLAQNRAKEFFKTLDYITIFLLIAGTYTPVSLVVMRGPWGWTLFGLIWAMALCGIIAKGFFSAQFRYFSLGLYLVMGWLILIAINPMLRMAPGGFIMWLVIGGACYTGGVLFYIKDRIPYFHFIWHLFVMAGSITHFFGMLFYLTRA